PIAAYLVMERWLSRPSASVTDPSVVHRRGFWIWACAAAVVGMAVLVPQLLAAHAAPLSLEKHEWLVGWRFGNAWKSQFHTPEGSASYRLPIGLFYLVRLGWPDYFFPSFGLFVLIGIWTLICNRRFALAVLLL